MSMYRVRNHSKRWQRRWPWKYFIPQRIDQRVCPECRMPFHEGPLPQEITTCNKDNVTAFVYPAGGFRKRDYVIRVGRWKAMGKQFFASEFIPAEDIPLLLDAIEEAAQEISALSASHSRQQRKVARRK